MTESYAAVVRQPLAKSVGLAPARSYNREYDATLRGL